jgi:hypothetical protein
MKLNTFFKLRRMQVTITQDLIQANKILQTNSYSVNFNGKNPYGYKICC